MTNGWPSLTKPTWQRKPSSRMRLMVSRSCIPRSGRRLSVVRDVRSDSVIKVPLPPCSLKQSLSKKSHLHKLFSEAAAALLYRQHYPEACLPADHLLVGVIRFLQRILLDHRTHPGQSAELECIFRVLRGSG